MSAADLAGIQQAVSGGLLDYITNETVEAFLDQWLAQNPADKDLLAALRSDDQTFPEGTKASQLRQLSAGLQALATKGIAAEGVQLEGVTLKAFQEQINQFATGLGSVADALEAKATPTPAAAAAAPPAAAK
jgi:hypothetical protein